MSNIARSVLLAAGGVLSRYTADGRMISFDQIGPIGLRPVHGTGWARQKGSERLRATCYRFDARARRRTAG